MWFEGPPFGESQYLPHALALPHSKASAGDESHTEQAPQALRKARVPTTTSPALVGRDPVHAAGIGIAYLAGIAVGNEAEGGIA